MPKGIPLKKGDGGNETITTITLMAHDSNVGKIYRRLQGLIVGDPKVRPVNNAKASGTAIVPIAGGTSQMQVFYNTLVAEHIKTFEFARMREFISKVGLSPNVAYQWRHKLLGAGQIKKIRGQKNHFEVIGA